jgi:hypothetical protein
VEGPGGSAVVVVAVGIAVRMARLVAVPVRPMLLVVRTMTFVVSPVVVPVLGVLS